ncbi:hypothetical protein CSH63_32220 [Micromonospora tulbaghiae]|uniref:Uncharacterized protein n=1 Tax=Micromonospora tulbaghiae TaxID=479978 RepID=A0A386WVD0_9ACTN|nr:hypothetical protein CSH63_32220 [Micromonospora tulbaghiae]
MRENHVVTDKPIRCTSTTRPHRPPYGTRVLEEDTGLIQEYRGGAYHAGWHPVSTSDSLCPAPYRALLAATDGALRDVTALHRPEPHNIHSSGLVSWWQCRGCDADGYDWEYPGWPCRTTQLIASQLGVSLDEETYMPDSTT